MSVVAEGPRWTPAELAAKLKLHPPTPEQAAVIAAPVEPVLVVAGAGSGKTETMAARVLWLVANGYVQPEHVLGLTFTRKAAGELAHRVRVRLGQLRRHIGEIDGEPTIATYHSFGARIVTEHGLRSGFEPSSRLLTEASCWQLADEVVRSYDGDMTQVDSAPSTVAAAILALAGEMAEHLVSADELAAWTGRFHHTVSAKPGKMMADVVKLLGRQRARLQLLPLVRGYSERKLALEAMDFGDQMSRAARVARDHPEVGAAERDRFRVVLLDEYQDTSHAQVVLLRALFGEGHPVTAVGDPCQSIYGWRGASAGTLERFPTEFPAIRNVPTSLAEGKSKGKLRRVETPALRLSLSRSFRNRAEILAVANAVSAPLRDMSVVALTSGSEDPAIVQCGLLETYLDEAEWIADNIVTAWRSHAKVADDQHPAHIPLTRRPTSAVLVRLRSQIGPIETALRARGLPVEVVGLGGLLDTPEVRDVVCTLRALADPSDGASLIRLLTGSRWRLGPRDLVALHRRSRELARERRTEIEPAMADRLDEAALSEALDNLGSAENYSAEGFARLTAYAREMNLLRQRLDQPLSDLIADISRTIGLDVEVAVRAAAQAGDAGLARAHLDTLTEVGYRFGVETDGAPLSAFLSYLAAAENEERGLAPGEVDVAEGAVQILTAHAAKGLEWDVVAVAGLSKGVWPGRTQGSDHYLMGLGVLPFPLRGDRSGLPVLNIEGHDQKALGAAYKDFEEAWREHDQREERRLAYVAVTRPRSWLFASGYWWGDGVKRPRGASPLLEEIAAVCEQGQGYLSVWTPPPPEDAVNPASAPAEIVWPFDPLGDRRPAVTLAAQRVLAATPRQTKWTREADLLLAERAEQARLAATTEVPLPGHLSVSQLVTLRKDPVALASSLRRPLPQAPDPYARRGTAFHRWLEERYGAATLFDLDEFGDVDEAPDDQLTALKAAFEESAWADRVPVAVETPFVVNLGGVVVRGRMDAVFASGDGFEVVDWKTGQVPSGAAANAAAIQLAAYRLAWASLKDIPVELVSAAFHYVRQNVTVRPADLLSAEELSALITELPSSGN
ncbi:ATP-dependent helicase [Catelliglobosispora koreensis]|uniref:ATP-dependent helicase n=1 Tax=Catelliglobosispora koreensis TaxID=129052 RepID=UPI00038280B3|nr:UvrD-helicase domain-containing protein [Catelliglobosispora koreensis]